MILRAVDCIPLSGPDFENQAISYRVTSKTHQIQVPWTFLGSGQTRGTRFVLDMWRCRRLFTRLHSSNWWLKGQESIQAKFIDAATWVTLLTTWSFHREPGWSICSARGGQFILSNAAGWNIFSAVFLLVKPRWASFSSIRRQSRTWTWLRYVESVQETSRRTKYGHEAFTERHVWKQCWTERYSNSAELICKTIEYVIRILRKNGKAWIVGARSRPNSNFYF